MRPPVTLAAQCNSFQRLGIVCMVSVCSLLPASFTNKLGDVRDAPILDGPFYYPVGFDFLRIIGTVGTLILPPPFALLIFLLRSFTGWALILTFSVSYPHARLLPLPHILSPSRAASVFGRARLAFCTAPVFLAFIFVEFVKGLGLPTLGTCLKLAKEHCNTSTIMMFRCSALAGAVSSIIAHNDA